MNVSCSTMSSFLIKALLSNTPNYEVIFDALSWPIDTWPERERLEALTSFIEGIGPDLTAPASNKVPTATRQYCISKIETIIWTTCIPLLTKLSEAVANKDMSLQHIRQSTTAVCRLLGVCIQLCESAVVRQLSLNILPSLQLSKGDDNELSSLGRLNIEVAIEVMAILLPTLSTDEHICVTVLSSALSCVKDLSEPVVSKITVRLLLTLLNCCDGTKSGSMLTIILDSLCNWHLSNCTPAVTERTLLCLTSLSDHIFPPERPQQSCWSPAVPRLSCQFWRILQDGLTHRDNVARKRALYLLKRCVALSEEEQAVCPSYSSDEVEHVEEFMFRWDPNRCKLLKEFWEDYALVMETLEENQIHVVRPVLNRIDTLIQTTAADSQDKTDEGALFHPSWLLCVYQRMFHSENKSLMREGVNHLLEMNALQQPAFAIAFSQFIVGPFMDVLSESSLYHRAVGQRVGECPELAAKLKVFMTTFFSSLPSHDRGCVLLQVIQRLGSQPWCAVPILFISQALSSLPLCPLLGPEGLSALREVMRCTMITHQVLLRGAAQCFLLHTALCFTDVCLVTLDDVFSFLMYFRADESLCRGTQLWDELVAWLSDNEGSFKASIVDGGTVEAYVQSEIQSFLRVPASTGQTEMLPEPKQADRLARAILLCVDMERRLCGGTVETILEALLSPLLDTLSRVSTNVYLPLRKTDKSLQLTLRLFQLGGVPAGLNGVEEGGDDVVVGIKKLIFKVLNSIQDFILRRLCGELQELVDVGRAELYLSVLRQLASVYSTKPHCGGAAQHAYFHKLLRNCLTVLCDPMPQVPTMASQVTRAVTMASVAMVCDLFEQNVIDKQPETMLVLKSFCEYFYGPALLSSHGQTPLGHLNQSLLKPPTGDCVSYPGLQAPVLQDWGRIAAQFMRDQWACLSFLTRTVDSPEEEGLRTPGELVAALSCSVQALALLPSDLVLPVLAFMKAVLPRVVLCEEQLCVQAVTLCWALVQGLSTNPHDFWPALKGFVSMAFQGSLLQLTDTQSPKLTALLTQIAAELMELSQVKMGVFNVLIQHCCQTWLPSSAEDSSQASASFSSVFNHMGILSEACVYGPVFRRDQRLIQEVQTYVEQLGGKCSANIVFTDDDRDDQLPRVCALAFLSRLDASSPLHERLMVDLALCLLNKDKEISKSKVRYYSNSLQHRVKNRVWQTLLLLLPKLKEDFVAILLNHVFEAAFCSNQPSVKYLIEWMMLVILERYPQHLAQFWACFSVDQEKTKTSTCTFLSVLVHLNVIVSKLTDKAVQWRRALDVVLQWCFSHNFSVRLYALLALKKVWALAEARAQAEQQAGGLGGLSTVVNACLNQAEAMQNTGNANKNWTRIQEHFFFGTFHPLRDYSVETLLYSLPSLSELADDEWILPWKFQKLLGCPDGLPLPLRNPDPGLSQLQPGDWIQQDKGEHDKEERWADVQKKITPWRLGIQEQGPELQLAPQQRAARLGKLHGALLVVASLIDKPTNLGGLCRTCEIFGASALVLDSLRHVSDKHFQSLSVSSELWLPLLEVKPVELADFLQLKSSEGYCIVGVEQTANSQSLQDYQFPEKTLLILGNEREGIPANLLQLLDVCVEIPQQGVIRSLNVHVSAALLIWEYTRQHLSVG